MIRSGREPLRRYRWSSYPEYLRRAGPGPAWLCRERVLAALGLKPGEDKRYEAYMESRGLELADPGRHPEWEANWRELRRGWYVGDEGFLDQLKARLGNLVAGSRRESHTGGARQAHDETAARALLVKGLKALGLSEGEAAVLPKGALKKTALAWWLRERTTVSLRWVSEALAMGHDTRVSQAVNRLRRKPGRKLKRLQQLLSEADGK
jgi:hypothetical protein